MLHPMKTTGSTELAVGGGACRRGAGSTRVIPQCGRAVISSEWVGERGFLRPETRPGGRNSKPWLVWCDPARPRLYRGRLYRPSRLSRETSDRIKSRAVILLLRRRSCRLPGLVTNGIFVLGKLGDEESVTEIQLLAVEEILVLAVPFAAGSLCSGEHATRSMTAATRWRSASESPTSKSLSPLPVSCAITSTHPADTPASPRRRRATCCSPGHLPGRPITPAPLGQRLAQLGIDAQTGSRAAMLPPLEGFPVRPARGAPRGPHRGGRQRACGTRW